MNEDIYMSMALGAPGSGRIRYGAAMAHYQGGQISAEQLECYRIASADDTCDPALLMRARGLADAPVAAPSAETCVRALVDEADAYLAKLPGPGIAEVRHGIARFRTGRYIRPQAAANQVVAHHLPLALSAAAESEPSLAAVIAATAPQLHWITYDLYDRQKIGEAFATSHAFCTLMGEQGAIHTVDFDFGLFLIAPHVLYRDHRHAAPELYAPLTGPHGWRFKPNAPIIIKQAHEPVWNEPHQPHLTKVGATPFLCFYCWTSDNDKPAEVLPANDWPEMERMKL